MTSNSVPGPASRTASILALGILSAFWLVIPRPALAASELQQAEQLVEGGRSAEALALIQRYGKSSDVAWAQVHCAALLASGQNRKAVDLLAPLHAADPLNLGLANNYAVALEAIGATDTARQVLERALGDGAATAAAFRNLRSLYAKLAAASYARAVDAPVQRMTPTLALVMPSAKQALAFTPGVGEGSPVLARGQAPAPSIAPMAALGPEAVVAPANAPSTANRANPSSTSAPAPVAQATVPGSTATAPSGAPGATASSSAQPGGKPPTPPSTTTAPTPPSPASAPGSAGSATGAAAATAKPSDKATDKASEGAPDKPVNERQAAALAQLERASANWAAAWSKKDVSTYLAFYAKTFQPPSGLSRSEWEKQRHDRLNRPGPIKVTIEELKVAPDGDGWRVTFRQHYRATGLESTATKSMRWVQEGGRWLIQAERAQ
jgi:hypothetical protein